MDYIVKTREKWIQHIGWKKLNTFCAARCWMEKDLQKEVGWCWLPFLYKSNILNEILFISLMKSNFVNKIERDLNIFKQNKNMKYIHIFKWIKWHPQMMKVKYLLTKALKKNYPKQNFWRKLIKVLLISMLRTANVDRVTWSTLLGSSNITLWNMRHLLAKIWKTFSEIRRALIYI